MERTSLALPVVDLSADGWRPSDPHCREQHS